MGVGDRNTQLALNSGVFLEDLRDHIGHQGSNSGRLHSRKMPYPVYYRSGPKPTNIFFGLIEEKIIGTMMR